jgi:hypothetical protein
MAAEHGTTIIVVLKPLASVLIPATPPDRMREYRIQEGVRVVRSKKLHVPGERGTVDKVPQRLNPAPVSAEQVLERFLELTGSATTCPAEEAGQEPRTTYWDLREVLQGALLPGIVDQSFPLAVEGILRIGRAWGVTALAAILAGQMKEARSTVIGNDALLIKLQALERSSQALGFVASDRTFVR